MEGVGERTRIHGKVVPESALGSCLVEGKVVLESALGSSH